MTPQRQLRLARRTCGAKAVRFGQPPRGKSLEVEIWEISPLFPSAGNLSFLFVCLPFLTPVLSFVRSTLPIRSNSLTAVWAQLSGPEGSGRVSCLPLLIPCGPFCKKKAPPEKTPTSAPQTCRSIPGPLTTLHALLSSLEPWPNRGRLVFQVLPKRPRDFWGGGNGWGRGGGERERLSRRRRGRGEKRLPHIPHT